VEVREVIGLRGPALDGVIPKGVSTSRVRGSRAQFKVQVERVNLADWTVLSVRVDGQAVGTITLAVRRGSLELSSQDGESVPALRDGSVVSVTTASGTVVLGGKS
jgi:hypothetical protein